MSADGARSSRFGEYRRGYSSPEFDGGRRCSRHVTVRDGTRIAIDRPRPTRAGDRYPGPLPAEWSFSRRPRSHSSGGELRTTFRLHAAPLSAMRHGHVPGAARAARRAACRR